MKHVIYASLLLLLISCSNPSAEELVIADYVQRIGTTKTDLSFKMKDLQFVKDISNQDSLTWYTDNYSEKDDRADSLTARLTRDQAKWKIQRREIFRLRGEAIKMLQSGNTYTVNEGLKVMKKLDNGLNEFGPIMERDSIFLTHLLKYNSDTQVLAKQYDAVYSIKNPILNNVEQELVKTFYLSSDLARVIRTTN